LKKNGIFVSTHFHPISSREVTSKLRLKISKKSFFLGRNREMTVLNRYGFSLEFKSGSNTKYFQKNIPSFKLMCSLIS